MGLRLEWKKSKHTHMLLILFLGALFACIIPLIQINLQPPADYTSPLTFLFGTNWLMMAMINTMLMIIFSCMLYHIEYANRAISHIAALPLSLGNLFLSKCMLLFLAGFIIYICEGCIFYICINLWFPSSWQILFDLIKMMLSAYILSFPLMTCMLWISCLNTNMWMTVGIGIIGVFASQIMNRIAVAAYLPFLMINQPAFASMEQMSNFLWVAGLESVCFLFLGIVCSHARSYSS